MISDIIEIRNITLTVNIRINIFDKCLNASLPFDLYDLRITKISTNERKLTGAVINAIISMDPPHVSATVLIIPHAR